MSVTVASAHHSAKAPGARAPRLLPALLAAVVLIATLGAAPPVATASPLVGRVDPALLDTELRWQTLMAPDTFDPASVATAPAPQGDPVATTRAEAVWSDTRGADTVVAVVDTGVAPVPALEGAVAGEIDFTGTGGGDGYGHGTFLASLIVGRTADVRSVAPEAGVLSLKVADATGATDLGTVLGALDWLAGPGRAAGIRIAVLALGTDADSPAGEVLDLAVERLAALDVLVVTSTGNGGPGALTAPASSPTSVSVGAMDDRGTTDRGDDAIAEFTATGADRTGNSQPDVLTTGVRVVGAMAGDSVIATANPEAVVGPGRFRGSGTSMATAVAGGVAALAADARPDLGGRALGAALTTSEELDAPSVVAAADAAATGSLVMADPAAATTFAEQAGALTLRRAERMATVERRRVATVAAAEQRYATAVARRPSAERAAAATRDATVRAAGLRAEMAEDAAEVWADAAMRRLERRLQRSTVPAPTTARWSPVRWDAGHWAAATWAVDAWAAHDWMPPATDDVGWDRVIGNVHGLTSIHWDPDRWGAVHWGAVHWGAVHWGAVHWGAAQWEAVHWGAAQWEAVHWGAVQWEAVHWSAVHWGLLDEGAAHPGAFDAPEQKPV